MAIDTHDDEAAARALLAAAEADTQPAAIRARIDLLGLKISLASCLLLAPIYIGLIFWWLDQTRRAEKETTLIQLLVQILFGGGTLLAIALFHTSAYPTGQNHARGHLLRNSSRRRARR